MPPYYLKHYETVHAKMWKNIFHTHKKPLSLYRATILYTHNCLSPPAGLLILPTKPYCHKIFKELIKSLQSHLQLVYRFMYTTYIKYNGYLGFFSGGKWPACNIDNPPPSSDEGKLYTYIPPQCLLAVTG